MLRACLTSKYIQKVGACNRERATELATAKRTGEKNNKVWYPHSHSLGMLG